MKKITQEEDSIVIRTDFSNDAVWKKVQTAITEVQADEMQANVTFIEDEEYSNLTIETLLTLIDENSEIEYLFLVDTETIENESHPVLCVDLYNNPGDFFRVIPSQMWSVENNLSLANMEFEDFKDATDSENIFRGF